MKRLGILVSGGGSNLQAIIDAIHRGELAAEVGVVISNKAGVYALERAERNQIPTRIIDSRDFRSTALFSGAIGDCLREFRVDLVCLAGFLKILDPLLTADYPNRILNIHPALLPAFGGRGMYGIRVHEAVIASGARFSGATVHLVTPEVDAGPIILQDIVAVTDNDTHESLAAKVLEIEHRIYPQAIKMVLDGQIIVDGLRVRRNLQEV